MKATRVTQLAFGLLSVIGVYTIGADVIEQWGVLGTQNTPLYAPLAALARAVERGETGAQLGQYIERISSTFAWYNHSQSEKLQELEVEIARLRSLR